jgi:hypothetical protein
MRCVLKELRQLRLFIGLSLLVTAIVPFQCQQMPPSSQPPAI